MAATITETVRSIQERFDAVTKETCNHTKILLFSETELMTMDLEDELAADKDKEVDDETTAMIQTLKNVSESIKLGYASRKKLSFPFKIIDKVDQIVRLFSVLVFLSTSGILFSLPCILFRTTDYFLVKLGLLPNHYQLSTAVKSFINNGILVLSGVHLVVEGLNADTFNGDVAVACFSHGSTMDAFILSGTIPVQQITMVKSDLFLVPFFSWLMFAFGCVPIDRSNREQAVKALADSVAAAKMGEAIAIAPEGSRSKTGLLLPFKKGPFYIWEQLKSPIVPLVITGAFDLYPPGNQMNVAGKVYCQYLKPIFPHEAATREGMSRLLRRRMLEAMSNTPADSAAPLTWRQRLKTWFYLGVLTSFFVALWHLDPYASLKHTYLEPRGISTNVFMFICVLAVTAITLILYCHVLYTPRVLRFLFPAKSIKKD